MTIEAEVANLTAQGAALLATINGQKDVLIQRVADATDQADRAAAQAGQVNTGVGAAAGSAAQALAIYGTAAAMQAKLDTAAAQASAAQAAATSAASVLQQDLSAVSAALHRSPNAIMAMCIYDLSKDTDSGAWVDRMGHTSWMNEPLNGAWRGALASEAAARAISGAATGDYFQLTTDGKFYKLNATIGTTEVFRGNKAKCARLTLPIAEAGSVSVFDGTEPGRPMWGRWAFAAGTFGTITSVSALNAKVLIGTTLGLITLDFAKDEGRFQQAAADRTFRLTDRASGSQVLIARPVQAFIVNNAANAVAMTVLPDAPFDVATGLQVPTIAVATAGGVSVIKHDGTVASSALTTSFIAVNFNGRVLNYLQDQSGSRSIFSVPVSGLTNGFVNTGRHYSLNDSPAVSPVLALGTVKTAIVNGGFLSAGALGLGLVRPNQTINSKGMVAAITGASNSGYMVGDIRRAYLCNTEVESVSAPELVVNGTFDTDYAGWSSTNSTLSVVGGRLRVTQVSIGAMASQVLPTVIGKTYKLSIDHVTDPITGSLFLNYNGQQTVIGGAIGTFVVTFTATSSATIVNVAGSSGGLADQYYEVDNISVKEVIPDRSYKAAAANIVGTLVKSQVASAAQLVAYSGFSATNYIQEPYSADMDYGVGEWSVGAWVSTTGYGPHNLVTYPAQFDLWGKASATVVPNQDGVADKIVEAVGGTYHNVYLPVAVAGSLFSVRFEAKAVERTKIWCQLGTSVATFDLVSGVATGAGASTVASAGGYWLCSYTGTPSSSTLTVGLCDASAATSYTGDGASGALLKNMQANRGSTPFAYVAGQTAAYDSSAPIADRSAATGPSIKLGLNGAGQLVATAYDGVTTRTVTTPAAYNTGVFTKASAHYTVAGKLSISVNGVEVASATGTPLLTLNNAAAVLTIGNSRTLDAPFPGSITLLKTGATVPTPEQSLWMYEQEKQMFRDGAQITLPAATGITDLAYDESQDKWTAVQAGYESSFTGLIRTSAAAPSAGSFSKIDTKSGVKLLARTTTSPGVDVTIPAYGLREELVRRSEAAARANRPEMDVDVDFIAGQTDWSAPVGFVITGVSLANAKKREGATKDYIKLFDGFRETARMAVAPGAGVWGQFTIRKE